jgi:hypothetical protein
MGKEYWTNVSKKPKGFKFIKSNVYEYDVYINGPKSKTSVYENEYFNYKEIIPIYYYVDELGLKSIDEEKSYESISKVIGIKLTNDNSSLERDFFIRDRGVFQFISCVKLHYLDTSIKYLEMKQLRERANKIKNIKKRL